MLMFRRAGRVDADVAEGSPQRGNGENRHTRGNGKYEDPRGSGGSPLDQRTRVVVCCVWGGQSVGRSWVCFTSRALGSRRFNLSLAGKCSTE